MVIVMTTIIFWLVSAFMTLVSLLYNLIKYLLCQIIWSLSKKVVNHNVEKPSLYFRTVYDFGVIFQADKLYEIIMEEHSK